MTDFEKEYALNLVAKELKQSAAADVVFRILDDAEKRIDALNRPIEKGGEG